MYACIRIHIYIYVYQHMDRGGWSGSLTWLRVILASAQLPPFFLIPFFFFALFLGCVFFYRAPCELRFFSRSLWAAFFSALLVGCVFFPRSLWAAFFFFPRSLWAAFFFRAPCELRFFLRALFRAALVGLAHQELCFGSTKLCSIFFRAVFRGALHLRVLGRKSGSSCVWTYFWHFFSC